MKHLTATEHGRLGYLTTSRSAKHNNGQIMSGAVSRELERLATKALGISPGPPTKAERHRPDTIRRDRPKQEVLFDTLEEDWMPETEPWETRFPSPVAAARRTDGLTAVSCRPSKKLPQRSPIRL